MNQISYYINQVTDFVNKNYAPAQEQLTQWVNYSVKLIKLTQNHIQQDNRLGLATIVLVNIVSYSVISKTVNLLNENLEKKTEKLSPRVKQLTHILFKSSVLGGSLFGLNTLLLKAVRISLNPAILAAGISIIVILHLLPKNPGANPSADSVEAEEEVVNQDEEVGAGAAGAGARAVVDEAVEVEVGAAGAGAAGVVDQHEEVKDEDGDGFEVGAGDGFEVGAGDGDDIQIEFENDNSNLGSVFRESVTPGQQPNPDQPSDD